MRLPSKRHNLRTYHLAMADSLFKKARPFLYAYALDNPINNTDPLGLSPGDWWDPASFGTLPQELNPLNPNGTFHGDLSIFYTGPEGDGAFGQTPRYEKSCWQTGFDPSSQASRAIMPSVGEYFGGIPVYRIFGGPNSDLYMSSWGLVDPRRIPGVRARLGLYGTEANLGNRLAIGSLVPSVMDFIFGRSQLRRAEEGPEGNGGLPEVRIDDPRTPGRKR